ncbi:MAG: hypothetical protein ATN33_01925 [Epulopiscium sp. Nele67-Bin001]|nr:MAG: hypothetical protein ATN33_01925 [Epulopiscium sp. Nele67-Bin001]
MREGYFARDKNQNKVEVEYKKNKDELLSKSAEDVERGIDLILDKKDELISFEEPLAFIFSHSALREGWDNPNVFTICTLKVSSSEITKKQEVGRGLRLPVDTTGNRCLDESINELTIIANENYETFAKALQDDFNDSMKFNKNEVTADILTGSLKRASIPQDLLNPSLPHVLNEELLANNIINSNNMLTNSINDLETILIT